MDDRPMDWPSKAEYMGTNEVTPQTFFEEIQSRARQREDKSRYYAGAGEEIYVSPGQVLQDHLRGFLRIKQLAQNQEAETVSGKLMQKIGKKLSSETSPKLTKAEIETLYKLIEGAKTSGMIDISDADKWIKRFGIKPEELLRLRRGVRYLASKI